MKIDKLYRRGHIIHVFAVFLVRFLQIPEIQEWRCQLKVDTCSLEGKGKVGKHQFFLAVPSVRLYYNLERLREHWWIRKLFCLFSYCLVPALQFSLL